MALTNTSESAMLADLSLDAQGYAQYQREKFQRSVLEAVATAGRLEMNIVSDALLALRMQAQGNDDCSVLLGHLCHRVTMAALAADCRRAERHGRDEEEDALLARMNEIEAAHRAGLQRLAPRSAMARDILAEMDAENN